ncbi:hypothetical protein [Paenibacillus arenilitoris]|uniref:Uncharacterized protein n=1 Tax=Paenibacillus arenilitoris TaxID=2772299 RepID=A0A927CTP9_9BACL|nr:hypothetical protein [Paenibacillus arenilitoris]MBD2872061.1 hypothetical protein [Paenibacillus arenilitoris]
MRKNAAGMAQACTLLFEAEVPPMGYAAFTLAKRSAGRAGAGDPQVGARMLDDRRLLLYSDRYELVLDLDRGGVIVGLLDKTTSRDYAAAEGPYFLNERRGCFIQRETFLMSRDTRVRATILEQGPLQASVRLDGVLGDTKFQFTVRLGKGRRAIEVGLKTWFESDQWIRWPSRCTIE